MKILYAVQGTGNGHISRARDIIPLLKKKAEVDILVSGTQADLDLGEKIDFYRKGLSFIFGKKGGVDLKRTFKEVNFFKFFKEVYNFPVKEYDLVINDFEPVSAWAAKFKGVHCVSLSHQCALLFENTPTPKKTDWLGNSILRFYAPSREKYGFHFMKNHPKIFTPVIRDQVRKVCIAQEGHYTVYLPSFSEDYLIKKLSKIKNARWEVFSKHTKRPFEYNGISVYPLNNEKFIESMAKSNGVLCGAGFETPAEALFLKKKLVVIPMKNQAEQQYNATALKEMGVPVLKNFKKHNIVRLQFWVDYGETIKVNYVNQTENILNTILDNEYYARHKKYSDIVSSAFEMNT